MTLTCRRSIYDQRESEIINSSGILGYERQADRVNEEDTLIPRHPVPDRLPPVGQAPLHVADCDMNWELSGCRSDRVLAAHTTTTVRTCHFTEALESIIGLNAAEGIKKAPSGASRELRR